MKSTCLKFLTRCAAGPVHAETSPAATRPNVVIILADDAGWGDLDSYGATRQNPQTTLTKIS